MSGGAFAGVALSRDLSPTAVVMTLSSDRRTALIEKQTLERLPRPAVVAVDRFDGSTLMLALYEAGHTVLPTVPSSLTRRAVGSGLRIEDLYRTSQDLAEAHEQATVFANDETRRFRDLSELAKATFLAMAAATLSVAPDAAPREAQQGQARRQPFDFGKRFPRVKVAVARLFQIFLSGAQGLVELIRSQTRDDRSQVRQQRQGGDFLRGAGAGEQVSEHSGVSKVAGCGTATGARVAGRFEQAAGDERAELRP